MSQRTQPKRAPIPAALRAGLLRDTQSVDSILAAAARHGDDCGRWEAQDEFEHAQRYFELGCWLKYFSERVGASQGPDGLADRIECVRKCWEAGVYDVGYSFYSVFRFGERQFDTCFEMGDGDKVAQALVEIARDNPNGPIADGVRRMQWAMDVPEPNDPWIATSAWGSWDESVPTGWVGVVACRASEVGGLDRRAELRCADPQRRHVLVPEQEYRTRLDNPEHKGYFHLDPAGYPAWNRDKPKETQILEVRGETSAEDEDCEHEGMRP